MAAEPPFLELRLVAVMQGDEEGRCAIALRTEAGWFLGTQTEESALCAQPSYVEVGSATVTGSHDVAVVEVTVNHHTKNDDDSGEHVWTSVCGVAAKGPWCTTHLTTACDPYVCVDDEERWTRTLEVVDDGTFVLSTTSASEAARRETGTFRLPR